MTVLRAVVTRVAVIVRTIAVAYLAVQVLIWHSFYAARPWLLWGPAAAAAWGAVAAGYLRHHQPGWRLTCVDTAAYIALALAAGWCLPLAVRGEAGNWLFIVVLSQFVVPIWFAPGRLSVPLALASVTGFWVGVALTPLGPGMRPDAVAAGLLMLAVAAMHWIGRRMLCARATRADLALAAADLDARDQYVVLSRTIERREHDRVLHDTVLNTLTAISRAGRSEAVMARCQRDIRVLERMLSEPEDPAVAVRSRGDLLAGLAAVASEMRGRGLTVHVAAQAGGTAEPGEPDGPAIPAPVAEAITQATREALANVAAHAGTGEAWITLGPSQPGGRASGGAGGGGTGGGAGAGAGAGGGGAGGPAGLRVTIRDEGVGFDPARVGRARLGLRRSITERVADWGGSVSVRSAPGQGTEVSLCWTGPAGSAPAGFPATGPAGFPATARSTGRGASAW